MTERSKGPRGRGQDKRTSAPKRSSDRSEKGQGSERSGHPDERGPRGETDDDRWKKRSGVGHPGARSEGSKNDRSKMRHRSGQTVSPKAKHAQKSALRAVRVNAGPAPVVEKKDQKDHLHELAKGHLHQEGPARVKLPVVVVAHARPPERKMANIANAQLQRNSVRIDHAPPVMHVPPAEA
ncbi:MAG: hypothetical protein IPI91_01705 [Flavobacteriales bacterium]|nr:hypothetical protein [Flavobacteriales bacterium]